MSYHQPGRTKIILFTSRACLKNVLFSCMAHSMHSLQSSTFRIKLTVDLILENHKTLSTIISLWLIWVTLKVVKNASFENFQTDKYLITKNCIITSVSKSLEILETAKRPEERWNFCFCLFNLIKRLLLGNELFLVIPIFFTRACRGLS